MQSILVAQSVIARLINTTFQNLYQKQIQTKLPLFILRNINTSLEETNLYQITQKPIESVHNYISIIQDHESIKADNFTPRNCKTCQKIESSPKLTQKGYSRYTKTISMRSESFQNLSDLKASKEKSPKNQKKYQVKQNSKSFIKLKTQTKDEIEEFKNQEKLRNELLAKKQIMKNGNQNLVQVKKKISSKNQNTANQLNDQKNYTFNHDYTILKSKQKNNTLKELAHSEKAKNLSIYKIQPFEEISELRTVITKSQILKKKKKSINQVSTPQIVQSFRSASKIAINSEKGKPYHQQIKINEERSESMIEMINGQIKIQRGIVIMEVIDSKIEKLKKDSVQIQRKIHELNKKQFEMSFAKKKFISRIQKSLNDI